MNTLYYTTKRPVTNMHKMANIKSEVVSQTSFGKKVTLLDRKGSWYLIETEDRYQGYIEGELVPCEKKSSQNRTKTTSLWSHVYLSPSVKASRPLMTLPFGTELEVVSCPEDEDGRWVEVSLYDSTGWIQRGDLTFNLKALSLAEMLTITPLFLGLPYTWGGTTSFGFDCSGFVQAMYTQCGILLPRDASLQAASSLVERKKLSSLEAGDLLFFAKKEKPISHVALMVSDVCFIHATTSFGTKPIIQYGSLLSDELKTSLADYELSGYSVIDTHKNYK